MQQGGGVDELDHRGELVRMRAAVSQRAGRQQQQHRAQALAAGADDVFGDLVDQHHIGGQAAADQCIDRGHVLAGEGLDRGQVRGRRGCSAGGQGRIGRHAAIIRAGGMAGRALDLNASALRARA